MATFRSRHKKDYTVIQNPAIRDTSISFKARGILHLLLSYPDDWIVSEAHIAQQSDCDGISSVRAGVSELIEAGYISRCPKRQSGRFSGVDYDVYEVPEDNPTVMRFSENGKTDNGKTDNGKTVRGKTVRGKTVRGKSKTYKVLKELSTELSVLDKSDLPSTVFTKGENEREPSNQTGKEGVIAQGQPEAQPNPGALPDQSRDFATQQGTPDQTNVPRDGVEAQFAAKPWRVDGKVDPAFAMYVGQQLPRDEMHPKAKGRAHILNLERNLRQGDWEKLQGYWEDYHDQSSPDSPDDSGDMPDWKKKFLGVA